MYMYVIEYERTEEKQVRLKYPNGSYSNISEERFNELYEIVDDTTCIRKE